MRVLLSRWPPLSRAPPSNAIVALIGTVATVTTQVVKALPHAIVATLTSTLAINHSDYEYAGKRQYQAKLDAAYLDYNKYDSKFKGVCATSKETPALNLKIDKILDQNPLLPPPKEIITQCNITMAEARELIKDFLARHWACTGGMPHKSEINRLPEDDMHIIFKEEYKNFVPPPKQYKTPVHLLPKLEAFLKELLSKGIIVPSKSPFCSPCLMVPKPHQEGVASSDLAYRMCVSLKDVNALTIPQHHRIPNITSIWSTLGKAKYLTVIDLESGFFQLNNCIADGSAAKTAFGCEFGHFEFVGCCMGAKNTPAHFQNRVEAALKRHNLLNIGMMTVDKEFHVEVTSTSHCVTPYIDDLVIYSETLEDHMRDLERVFKCLSEEQYYIKPSKCAFCCKYVKSLGAIVGNGIIACDPVKIESVYNWAKPVDMTSLRSFLGIANYLKNWYKDYSKVVHPLTQLMKKGVGVKAWCEKCDLAFETVKNGFLQFPILRLPDFTKPMVVCADACDISLGGAIMQEWDTPDGTGKQMLSVSYYSCLFNKHEINYPVREKECLALHDLFKKHEYLLVGSKFTVGLHTDHSSLLQLKKSGPIITNRRLLRWLEYFSGFDFDIKWVAGSKQLFGDGVSRNLRYVEGLKSSTFSSTQ